MRPSETQYFASREMHACLVVETQYFASRKDACMFECIDAIFCVSTEGTCMFECRDAIFCVSEGRMNV
jgi:hypothetical protein